MMAAIAEGNKPLVRQCKEWFDWAVRDLGVANADILGLTTVLGSSTTTSLVGMIGAKTAKEIDIPKRNQCRDAMAVAKNIGILTDTNVAAADTVAGIRALFNAQDSSLSATLSDLISAPFPVGHPQTLA
jgi:hypothetical protein